MEKKAKLLPVTVLSGFLGAGKTTLLKHILRSVNSTENPLRVAVIVNDMGEINLDASEIKNTKLVQEEAQMVELHNGCICCTLRDDLLKTVKSLSEEATFDYLVIESTGISEPLPVAQTFTMDVDGQGEGALPFVTRTQAKAQALGFKADTDEQQRQSLSKFARLDTLVTVVDALNVWDALASLETLAERNSSGMVGNTGVAGEGTDSTEVETPDDRSISQLLLDQIEFANVLLLSKSTMLQDDARLAEIAALLQKLNPGAKVIVPKQKNFQDLPLDAIMNTELFNMEKAQASEEWLKELAKPAHTPETEEYGVASVVFQRRDRPFHPQRLKDLLVGFGTYAYATAKGYASHKEAMGNETDSSQPTLLNGVLRAKGRLWIASAHAHPVNLHSAGRQLELAPSAQPYLAAVDQAHWDENHWKQHKELVAEGQWDQSSGYGDRESKAIFIGVHMDKGRILKALGNALLTDAELAGGVESWRKIQDVFFDGDYFDVHLEEEEDSEESEEDEDMEDEELEEDECAAADGNEAAIAEPPRKVPKRV